VLPDRRFLRGEYFGGYATAPPVQARGPGDFFLPERWAALALPELPPGRSFELMQYNLSGKF